MSKFRSSFWVVNLLMILALLLGACTAVAPAAPAAEAPAAEAPAAAADVKIGLVTDVGRVNDRSCRALRHDYHH